MCHVHLWPWPLTSISKLYISPWIWVWQNVFALWHRHTEFWYMGVSPWDIMLCTFLTLVWPDLWHICGWRGVSLVSFTCSFYLVSSIFIILRLYIRSCFAHLWARSKSSKYLQQKHGVMAVKRKTIHNLVWQKLCRLIGVTSINSPKFASKSTSDL